MKKYLLVVSFLVAVIFISPNISLAATTAELQARIAQLLAEIQKLQSQMPQQQPQQWCYDFKYNLNAQSRGKEISQLQTALEKEGFEIEQSEKINQTFGESTADAVVGFQQKYKDEVLSPYKLRYGTGFVGKSTRAKLNSLYGCGIIKPQPIPVPIIIPVPVISTSTISPAISCSGLEMVWPTSRREPYSFSGDTCAGYRYLNGKEISPFCYNYQECVNAYSNANCINIPSVQKQCSASIISTPSITVLSPNSGEKWEIGKTYTIKWSSQNIPSNSNVTIELVKLTKIGNTSSKIYGYERYGAAYIGTSINDGVEKWTVPNNIQTGDQYIIDISGCNTNVKVSESESGYLCANTIETASFFSIVAGTSVSLSTSFNYTETNTGSIKFSWNIENANDAILSIADSQKIVNITNPATNVSYGFNFYNSVATSGSINLLFTNSSLSAKTVYATLTPRINGIAQYNSAKTIVLNIFPKQSALTITSPNGGEVWAIGSNHEIKWTPDDGSKADAYLEKLVNGQFVNIGKIYEVDRGSIIWAGEINQYANYAPTGEYYIRVVTESGAWDRSDKSFTLVAKETVTANLKVNGSDGPADKDGPWGSQIVNINPLILKGGESAVLSWTSSAVDNICKLDVSDYGPVFVGSTFYYENFGIVPIPGGKIVTIPAKSLQVRYRLECSSSIGNASDIVIVTISTSTTP